LLRQTLSNISLGNQAEFGQDATNFFPFTLLVLQTERTIDVRGLEFAGVNEVLSQCPLGQSACNAVLRGPRVV
jgi:hypothetical protein